jgi:hypothetical protein
MQQYERDTLLEDLRNSILEVTFTKVNGQRRSMRCTLMTSYLPENHNNDKAEQQKEKSFHKENPDVLAVWDVQNGGWRSFRIDSVEYVQMLDNNY